MKRALRTARTHWVAITSPLWVAGIYVGIAVATGVVEVARGVRAERRADRAYDQWGYRRNA